MLGAASSAGEIRWWENTAGDGSVWTQHAMGTDFFSNYCVISADFDGDGDIDVLSASWWVHDIFWWENTAGDGSAWTEHLIGDSFRGPWTVLATDIDNDGDIDVLGAASRSNDVFWWENTAGDGSTWTGRLVDGEVDTTASVFAADIDGDGDTDVFATAAGTNEINWWENMTIHRSALPVAEHTIDNDFDGASSVFASDIDGDGDTDVLGAAYWADDITWWENTVSDGSAWTEHTIDDNFDGAYSVLATDIDGDGDTDVLGAAREADDITWWENTTGDGSAWAEHTINAAIVGALSIFATDFDGDGDTDVLGAAPIRDFVIWWENTAGNGSVWAEHLIDDNLDGAHSVFAADIDYDGDLDVLSAAGHADEVTWWKNHGGQFALATSDITPSYLKDQAEAAFLLIEVDHNGRSGDTEIELVTLELLFESQPGVPLTSAEANAMVENLFVYRDDGSGLLDPADTLVATIDSLTLTAGQLNVGFVDGDTSVLVEFGASQTYFLVIQATPSASSQSPNTLKITHLTDKMIDPLVSSAEDRDHDIPLSLEWVADVSSSTVEFILSPIFSDDFETSDTSKWSSVVP